MLCNITLCKTCLNRLVNSNKLVRCKSHYAVLDVSHKASQKEIRDAYIKLSKRIHPDQNRQDTKSHDKFVKINEAYAILSKTSSRRDYDEKIGLYAKPSSNPFQTSSRPPNYYGGDQFYGERPFRSGFDPSNPYGRRANNTYQSDPFTDFNYDYGYYQRKRSRRKAYDPKNAFFDDAVFQEIVYLVAICFIAGPLSALLHLIFLGERKDDSKKIDGNFYQKVMRIYAYFIALPFYIGCFYGIGARNKQYQTYNPEGKSVILVAVLIICIVVLYLECTMRIMRKQKGEGAGISRNALLVCVLLLLPILTLRGWMVYTILLKDTLGVRVIKRPRPLTKEERQAAEEVQRLRFQFTLASFGIFVTVLVFVQILTEDDYIVTKQEEKAGVKKEEDASNWQQDPVIIWFERIFWGFGIAMLLYLLKEVIYAIYVDVTTSKLKETLERKKKMQEQKEAESIVRSIYPDAGKGSS